MEYVGNLSLLNDVKSSAREKDNVAVNEAYVWGSNSSHQLGEELVQDKVMSCKKSTAFEQASQVRKKTS